MMSAKKPKFANAAEDQTEAVDFAQKSVDQAQVAFEKASVATQENVGVLDTATITYKSGMVDFQKKAMEFANTNMEQAFAFSRKLFAVKEFGDVVSLQQSFVTEQAESFKAQAGELNEIALRVSAEAAKPLTQSFEKSLQTFSKSFAA
jgi:phasin family protein